VALNLVKAVVVPVEKIFIVVAEEKGKEQLEDVKK
jgi:hypothetical protein